MLEYYTASNYFLWDVWVRVWFLGGAKTDKLRRNSQFRYQDPLNQDKHAMDSFTCRRTHSSIGRNDTRPTHNQTGQQYCVLCVLLQFKDSLWYRLAIGCRLLRRSSTSCTQSSDAGVGSKGILTTRLLRLHE